MYTFKLIIQFTIIYYAVNLFFLLQYKNKIFVLLTFKILRRLHNTMLFTLKNAYIYAKEIIHKHFQLTILVYL